MKFAELFETPTYLDRELPVDDVSVGIMSVDTLDREYTLLGSVRSGTDQVVGALKNNHKSAVIGHAVMRDDGKYSIRVVTTLTFHEVPDLGELKGKTLQVDTVVSTDEARGAGYGYTLYKMLLNAGFTLASDNIQYRGGRELWKKIIRRAPIDGHVIMILQNGVLMRDQAGAIIHYDGSNVPADVIWSTNPRSVEHYNTLLVVRNK
jgi:hypothetical protein